MRSEPSIETILYVKFSPKHEFDIHFVLKFANFLDHNAPSKNLWSTINDNRKYNKVIFFGKSIISTLVCNKNLIN